MNETLIRILIKKIWRQGLCHFDDIEFLFHVYINARQGQAVWRSLRVVDGLELRRLVIDDD